METKDLIPAEEFCNNYNVEVSFIHLLNENGLIEMITLEEKRFIPVGQLVELEKLLRLHYELDINLEGIEAIGHLLNRLRSLQEDLATLKSRLQIYEQKH